MDSDSEEEKMEKKRRRRIKKPVPDSSDEDGEVLTSFVLFKSATIVFQLLYEFTATVQRKITTFCVCIVEPGYLRSCKGKL